MLIIGEFSISRHIYIFDDFHIFLAISKVAIAINSICILLPGDQRKYSQIFSNVLDVSFTRPLCFTPRLEISWNTVSRERFIIDRQLRIGETVNVGTCWVSGKVIDATSKPSVSSPPFLESNIFKLEGSRSKRVSMVFGSIDENMECVFAD